MEAMDMEVVLEAMDTEHRVVWEVMDMEDWVVWEATGTGALGALDMEWEAMEVWEDMEEGMGDSVDTGDTVWGA